MSGIKNSILPRPFNEHSYPCNRTEESLINDGLNHSSKCFRQDIVYQIILLLLAVRTTVAPVLPSQVIVVSHHGLKQLLAVIALQALGLSYDGAVIEEEYFNMSNSVGERYGHHVV